jgi:DNA-binding phage protein
MTSSLKLYKSYNFVDKDPIIDRMRNISERNEIGIPRIAAQSGVSEGTIRNWFYGKTKRPQYATVAAVMIAMGYRVEWTKS